MNRYEELINKQARLAIVHPNMSELFNEDPNAYTLARRVGLGASDASVYLGVNLYTSVDKLIAEKRSTVITEDEKAIADIEAVRKGRDLEPIIIGKFENQFHLAVDKPEAMYCISDYPQLLINYDGLTIMGEQLIPVEAKFVTQYGTKYYNPSKGIKAWSDGTPLICGGRGTIEHITEEAALYGIPAYYYTQLQQQMLGVNAPFAYLVALFDKGWRLCVFKVFKDEYTQNAIITESAKLWHRIKGE